MAFAAPRAEVHQPLDAHRDFAAEVTFDRKFLNLFPQPVHLVVGEVLDLGRDRNVRASADRARARTADAENHGERDFGVLLVRDVDATYTGHDLPRLERKTVDF